MKTRFEQTEIQIHFDGYDIYDFVLFSHYFFTEKLPPIPGYYTRENHSITPIDGLEVVNISAFMADVLNGSPRLFDLMDNFMLLKRKYKELDLKYSELNRAVGVNFIKNNK